jgi:hypothetical protein
LKAFWEDRVAQAPAKTERPAPVRQDEVERRLLDRRESRVRLLIADARDVAQIQESRHYELGQFASLRQYGEVVLHMSGRETFELASIGRALVLFPDLEAKLLQGSVTPEAAAVLGLFARRPELVHPDDRWLERSEGLSAKELRREVDQRLREGGAKTETRSVTLHLTEEGVSDLAKVQRLASPSEAEPVSPSPAAEIAFREYVHRKDPLERTPGVRRMAPTDDPLSPRTRSVPADVNRLVIARAKSKCRIAFCDNDRFVDRVHVHTRHCDGGSREADNLDLHCRAHHRMQEKGLIRNLGTTDEPHFVDASGRSLHKRRTLGRGPPPAG